MLRIVLLSLALSVATAACQPGKPPKDGAEDKKPDTLQVAPEDTLVLRAQTLSSGPVITGSIQPERRADLRAEISAVVLQVLKENGDAVRQGDVLLRLDDTAIRDNLRSAEDSARSASQALDQAERTLQRLQTLRASGMSSLQALDDAEVRRNASRSELSAAQARVVGARQQLQRTVVRAPFDGVVSERKVSAGDTAAIGKELLKVIDTRSMRFAGRIATDQVGLVQVGQPVRFRIHGYGEQDFQGSVLRLDPSANDVTRQVEVLVRIHDSPLPQVAGLYAEGSIASSQTQALSLPESVLVRSGDKTWVWRIQGEQLAKVPVTIGPRDARTGQHPVLSGLNAGDTVLRSPQSQMQDGQKVQRLSATPTPQAKASAATGAP